MSETFTPDELNLIEKVKVTLRILAKVMRDKDVNEVIKDEDLAHQIDGTTLEEALAAEPGLGDQIKNRITPDIPQFNDREEAVVIYQLAPAVFSELIKKQ